MKRMGGKEGGMNNFRTQKGGEEALEETEERKE